MYEVRICLWYGPPIPPDVFFLGYCANAILHSVLENSYNHGLTFATIWLHLSNAGRFAQLDTS